ncbi:Cysteine-rich transmembrane CYSTM domain-containing protein [Caenorhabditis elegans]|uniref:Cysteine-rich transmembrane CYSTM domain-containing protein n=1 Tax=Caenorhabditis elegans TaxID=6239 RepID=B5U8P5_CAEEL|nr:Cysteine-rich transmembrane CYSTM domain-containing protein [Caenorhabditis elegans]CAR64687.1 Cysteine-rich transmembrane CYSTM domain-containing protein [Caenorhabditis elegans]|eukprot:NP_001256721.1 Uncharacterized protein CELE_W06G6.20 [Caenorhabditis elegans]
MSSDPNSTGYPANLITTQPPFVPSDKTPGETEKEDKNAEESSCCTAEKCCLACLGCEICTSWVSIFVDCCKICANSD